MPPLRHHLVCPACGWETRRNLTVGKCTYCDKPLVPWDRKLIRARPALPTECDCGEPVTPGEEACARCLLLDGATPGEFGVIAALRIAGKAAPCELEELTGLSNVTVHRALKSLKEKGRVAYLGREVYIFESDRSKGITKQQTRCYYELRSTSI